MDKVHILPTDLTPEVILKPEGSIKIKGRGMVVNKKLFPEKITNWLDAYLQNPAEKTYVYIAFEYLNSFSTTILAKTLIRISESIHHNKKLIIYWYYEEGDDDILERGEYIEETFNLSFAFIMVNDIYAC